MTVVLALEGVSKSFGGVRVIDDLSVSLHEGEALGVVGPNGAGKTTIINLVSGLLAPSAGALRFELLSEGRDIGVKPTRSRIQGQGRGRSGPRGSSSRARR